MTSPLQKSFPRLWTLESGIAMVVTDLHGDWDAYTRYRDRFITLFNQGQAHWLIFTGDLIHADKPENDRSLDIIFDVLELRKQYGEAIIYLCGNHEMPHIYGITLSKGDLVYTPHFEKVLSESQRRDEVIDLFKSLPFYLRTAAGVSVAHAGAPSIIAEPGNAPILFNWSHDEMLAWANEIIAGEDIAGLRIGFARQNDNVPYHLLAQHYLAVSDSDDPRYDDLLRGFITSNHPTFNKLLWRALFTRSERDYGLTNYKIFLRALLQELSVDYSAQQVLVAGHMAVKEGGCAIVADQQLRLASGYHAHPRESGFYLLFDAGKPVASPYGLLDQLGSVF